MKFFCQIHMGHIKISKDYAYVDMFITVKSVTLYSVNE